MKIVTLTTCHNRRAKTVRALRSLTSQLLPHNVETSHILVDDGSTDGTAHAVRAEFPQVEIIPGTGQLFWAGGMRFGWEQSVRGKEFDFLFVYNDDVDFDADALARLLSVSAAAVGASGTVAHAVVGSCRSRIDGSLTYGGRKSKSRLKPLALALVDPPTQGFVTVGTLNMNCALISASALEMTDFLSARFIHGLADFEFGLRLRKRGGQVFLPSGHFGFCERDSVPKPVIVSVRDYLRRKVSAKASPLGQTLYYCRTHGGLIWWYWFIRSYVTRDLLRLILTGRWT